VLRSDNLSAATHELPMSGGRALPRRYQSLLDHYELKSTRIFPRKAHENGVVEQAHRRTKSILAQMLRPLPVVALPAYTTFTVMVRRWSTIRVVNHTYSVPARLIGERVRVHLHHDQLEVYYAGKLVEQSPACFADGCDHGLDLIGRQVLARAQLLVLDAPWWLRPLRDREFNNSSGSGHFGMCSLSQNGDLGDLAS
jgi:hypothetical protein